MAVSATGKNTQADLLADLFADGALFQTWVGYASDATNAKTRVYIQQVLGDDAVFPAALILEDESEIETDFWNYIAGTMRVRLMASAGAAYKYDGEAPTDRKSALYDFNNDVKAIIDQAWDVSRDTSTKDRLDVQSIRNVTGSLGRYDMPGSSTVITPETDLFCVEYDFEFGTKS